ncbi:MAG: sialate O-acetylesterase, partial [Verrucomicrobiota bacterium]|nr:sialate O-acetylesterase [Verrucomicrobiota bacterium]
MPKRLILFFTLVPFLVTAETRLPSIIGNHMVLQRDVACPIWGWDDAGREVTVSFAGQTHSTKAGKDGRWQVKLKAMPANAKGATLTIKGSSTHKLGNVLVGEVWVCSGQSNMAWSVDRAYDPDLESLTAKFPNIRLISVPQVGTQEPQKDFKGEWVAATPETVKQFSAVGYFFGRTLHQALDVPVGLIDNAWGGSAAEAWIRRDLL